MYKVSIAGEELGHVENKQAFEENIKEQIISENSDKNIDDISLKEEPVYELEFVNRTQSTEENQVIENIQDDITVTYKYYEVALDDIVLQTVNTDKEAEELVNTIKEEKSEENLNLSIAEKYTDNEEEVKTEEIGVAKLNIETKVDEIQKQKEEEERINAMPDINGIKLAELPISGVITSRYGVSSNIRKSTHTGLDIAATTGTPIKVMANGTVTCASYNGSYGNLVKVDHGNGVETWYGHTSKMYVHVGQVVNAGDVIAAVGSTGNSTGPHLHLEIRINGQHVNPQKYVYK